MGEWVINYNRPFVYFLYSWVLCRRNSELFYGNNSSCALVIFLLRSRFPPAFSLPSSNNPIFRNSILFQQNKKKFYFMEDLYSIHPGISRGWEASTEISGGVDRRSDLTDRMKAQIASHPRYPSLVSAYIECRKVGAPPEMATLLEEIGKEKCGTDSRRRGQIGADPELDEFMESYCAVLEKYKEDLSRPFDEAATFLSSIETQLRNLCSSSSSSSSNGCTSAAAAAAAAATTTTNTSDEAVGSSEEELSCGDAETSEGQDSGLWVADHELKEMLLKKYRGYLSSLRKEFLKTRKKGKLPKDARLTLMDWWNAHYQWPYPTEEEKAKLAELTGLDQKQINNWFINQRKRHWKPSEDLRFALMEGVSGGSSGTTLYFDTGMIGPGTT